MISECKESTLQGWYNHFAYKVQHHPSGRRMTSSWKGGCFFPLVSMRPCMPKCARVWWVKDCMQVGLGRHELTAENNPICKTAPIWQAPSFLSLYHVLTDGIWIVRIKDRKDLLAHLSFYCQASLTPCHIFRTAFIKVVHRLPPILWQCTSLMAPKLENLS